MFFYRHIISLTLFSLVLILVACTREGGAIPTQHAGIYNKEFILPGPDPENIPADWQPLGKRLFYDGLYDADIEDILRKLPKPSEEPMSRKIRELYLSAFTPPPPPVPKGKKKTPPRLINTGIVNKKNAELCRQFLLDNKEAFTRAEEKYGVPQSIAVSLLFVETRLGEYLGKDDVFYTLASMASSRQPEQILACISNLEDANTRLDWISRHMEQRSNWAYRELVAFIRYARANNFQMLSVPGSIYGAMGMCQFMPSNIVIFGADGDNDGIINLFVADDAIASLSKYLAENGWKKGASRASQHAALKRYNRLNIYANNILCLADLVRGEPMGKPVIPAKKSAGKKIQSRVKKVPGLKNIR